MMPILLVLSQFPVWFHPVLPAEPFPDSRGFTGGPELGQLVTVHHVSAVLSGAAVFSTLLSAGRGPRLLAFPDLRVSPPLVARRARSQLEFAGAWLACLWRTDVALG